MPKEKIKVYLYTRVSTAMQIDGYSLEAQKTKMKASCDYNEYEIAGEYEDAGKSGKSIEGRVSFNQMMEEIRRIMPYIKDSDMEELGEQVLGKLQSMTDEGFAEVVLEPVE